MAFFPIHATITPVMKVRSALFAQTSKALSEALGFPMIQHIASRVFGDYDIHQRMGIQENIPITREMAAERVMRDVTAAGLYLPLVEEMIAVDLKGYMGREYPIPRLAAIAKFISAEGYCYDQRSGLFMEHAVNRVSPNWGRLVEGEEKQIVLLRLDIVDNSGLVKGNTQDAVETAYTDVREIVDRAVISRHGRIWLWEGDGGMAAFLFSDKERSALFAGMEILHELFFYNRLQNPLIHPIRVRIATHAGPIRYSSNQSVIKKNETVRELVELESACTPNDSLTASINVSVTVDRAVRDQFGADIQQSGYKFCRYTPALEGA